MATALPLIESLKVAAGEKKDTLTDPNNRESFFRAPYFGADVVDKLHNECRQSTQMINDQSKFLIGLVQASLSGKTRLILELSLRKHPICLISFKSKNDAFQALVQKVRQCERRVDTFNERRCQNRYFMLLVRIFYLSYLVFLELYIKEVCNKGDWFDLDDIEKKVVFALVINGGSKLVERCFLDQVEKYELNVSSLAELTSKDLDKLKTKVKEDYKKQLESLKNPWFALDECHIPTSYLSGVLFHSDYKQRLEEGVTEATLLEWQLYEQFSNEQKIRPSGYSYLAATTLFSAFRWLSEEFLTENNQMTIFASTYYSCWDSLLDRSKYSREKININPFTDLHLLTVQDLLAAVTNSNNNNNNNNKEECLKNFLKPWQGRPGFFFEDAWRMGISNMKDISQLTATLEEAKSLALQRIRRIAEHIELNVGNHTTQKKLALEYLKYRVMMHGGCVKDKDWTKKLVSGGLVVRGATEDESFVSEPLIQEFVNEDPPSFTSLQNNLLAEPSLPKDTQAEYAVALQLIQFRNKSVRAWIESCAPETVTTAPDALMKLLNQFTLAAAKSAGMDELGIKETADAFQQDSPLWSGEYVLRAKTGLALPDVMVVAKGEVENEICCISIQLKTWNQKLTNPKDTAEEYQKEKDKTKFFPHALESTTCSSFFHGHLQQQQKFKAHYEQVRESKKILHVRVISCWSGFSQLQSELVKQHNNNSDSMDQPIFLICPSSENVGSNIYGGTIFKALKSQMNALPGRTRESKITITNYQRDLLRMKLHEREKWRTELDNYEDEIGDMPEGEAQDEEEGNKGKQEEQQ